jgi:hypothetical protein
MKQKFLKADQLKQLLKNYAEQDGTKSLKLSLNSLTLQVSALGS